MNTVLDIIVFPQNKNLLLIQILYKFRVVQFITDHEGFINKVAAEMEDKNLELPMYVGEVALAPRLLHQVPEIVDAVIFHDMFNGH